MRAPRYREGPEQVNGEGRDRPIGARRGRLKLVGREMLDILTSARRAGLRVRTEVLSTKVSLPICQRMKENFLEV